MPVCDAECERIIAQREEVSGIYCSGALHNDDVISFRKRGRRGRGSRRQSRGRGRRKRRPLGGSCSLVAVADDPGRRRSRRRNQVSTSVIAALC